MNKSFKIYKYAGILHFCFLSAWEPVQCNLFVNSVSIPKQYFCQEPNLQKQLTDIIYSIFSFIVRVLNLKHLFVLPFVYTASNVQSSESRS